MTMISDQSSVDGGLWALVLALLLLLVVWAWTVHHDGKEARKWAKLREVPCESCQQGYNAPHSCESLDYCMCDQPKYHLNK